MPGSSAKPTISFGRFWLAGGACQRPGAPVSGPETRRLCRNRPVDFGPDPSPATAATRKAAQCLENRPAGPDAASRSDRLQNLRRLKHGGVVPESVPPTAQAREAVRYRAAEGSVSTSRDWAGPEAVRRRRSPGAGGSVPVPSSRFDTRRRRRARDGLRVLSNPCVHCMCRPSHAMRVRTRRAAATRRAATESEPGVCSGGRPPAVARRPSDALRVAAGPASATGGPDSDSLGAAASPRGAPPAGKQREDRTETARFHRDDNIRLFVGRGSRAADRWPRARAPVRRAAAGGLSRP